jgi:plasmid stabilization system protein ParE
MTPTRLIGRLEAEVDITDAAIWYERQRAGLGHEFLAEVDASFQDIASNPLRFPCLRRRPEVRRALLHRFPYRIFFIRRPDTIIVFRVLHAARRDQRWTSSLPER